MKSPAKMLTDLVSRLAGARSALDELHDTDKTLRTMHEDLQAERRRLCGARPPKADLIAEAERQVDAIAAAWVAAHGPQLVDAIAGRVDASPAGVVRGIVEGNLLLVPFVFDVQALLALAPDPVKQSLRTIITGAEYAEGPPMSARAELIAAVDAKIADVEEQHSALVDQALALGIQLDLLDAVRSRRARAAYLAEVREHQARDLARTSRS